MKLACQDLKERMVHARDDNEEFMQAEGYSDDLIQCLKKEKDSVADLIEFMEDTIANIHAYMQAEANEGEESKDGEKEEDKAGTEEEVFADAKEDESVVSMTSEIKKTSKTQRAAGDSQKGAAEDAVPRPITKEGGQEVVAASGHGDG